jgi:hypothetical protein
MPLRLCRFEGRLSWVTGAEIIARTALSLFPNQNRVNGKNQPLRIEPSSARLGRLILADKLHSVLDKTDEHNHGRASQTDKKHDFQQPHCKDSQLHKQIVAFFPPCLQLSPENALG